MDGDMQSGLEYNQLTPEQQAQALSIFGKDNRPMEHYLYVLRDDGTVFQWRYFKSEMLNDKAVLKALFE